MGTLLLTCKMCGTQFEYFKESKTGMIPKYCSDVCRAKAQKEARKKYLENCKDKKAAKSKLRKMMEEQSIQTSGYVSSSEIAVIPDEAKVSFSTTVDETIAYEREAVPTADKLTMKVLDFAMRLGQLKYEGHELLTELSKITSEQDKQDEKFIHLVEAMDKVTIGQMKEIWTEEANSRTYRRDVKTLYRIINSMIYNIPQNPHQYARKEIENKQKTNASYAEKYANVSMKPKEEEVANDN